MFPPSPAGFSSPASCCRSSLPPSPEALAAPAGESKTRSDDTVNVEFPSAGFPAPAITPSPGSEGMSGTAADELARYITGKAPSDAARKEYADKFPNASDTPRVAAGKYNAMADLLEGRLKDMEKERNENFSGKDVSKDYPIALPEHQKV